VSLGPPALDPAVRPAARLRGELTVPSDKSIAHRALISNAVAGPGAAIRVRDPGADVRSTVACLRALGLSLTESANGPEVIWRLSAGELRASGQELDCGNSGTTMRLLAGVLAARPGDATLSGDGSLQRRPMERVAVPLRAMGARVDTSDGCPPVRIMGAATLHALEHRLPVASAQLIGAVSLAALAAKGETRILSPGPTRDHTERMLAAMGVAIERRDLLTQVTGPARPRPLDLSVPGDASAAAAWLVAASVHPDARLRLRHVSLNPTRLAIVDALREMGARIRLEPSGQAGPEPVGDLVVESAAPLRPLQIGGERVAELIDELPLLAVTMAATDAESEVRDAAELRVKESDRIRTLVTALHAIGARVEELPDGWRVSRGTPREAVVATAGDHRIAIALAVAAVSGVAASVRLDDPECTNVSYPSFWTDLARVSGQAA
jgi:3-phosphoshikimate 1-carboxyvinyltransferase